jgi:riboflavin synthase
VRFTTPRDPDGGVGLARYIVEKGSIAVDGVSLTVTGVDDDGFSVGLIPTTLAETTLGSREVGATVNLEVDVLAKYVERLLSASTTGAAAATKGSGA